MKLRSFFSVLAGVVVVLLLTATLGAYWLFSQSPLGLLKGGEGNLPGAAIFIPRQAPAMVSLLASPEQLESFRLVAANPAERRRARAELTALKQNLLSNTGLSYEQDIQPWLGQEITLAITTLDIDRDASNGKQPGYLLAIATQNPERSREFLQLFWQKRAIAGADLTFEQYKGVKLIYGNPIQPPTSPAQTGGTWTKRDQAKAQTFISTDLTSALASAVVSDRYVLFANHPKVLRDAINNVQVDDLNLSNASFYNQAIATLAEPRIGLSFVNLPRLAEWLGATSPTEATASSPNQTLAIALELNQAGLLAETALSGVDTPGVIPTLKRPVAALKYLPANSPLAASGANLEQLWAQLSGTLAGYETVSQLVNQPLTDLQKRLKIDLPIDIFSWVTGEYALGLLPPDVTSLTPNSKAQKSQARSSKNQTPTEWVFVAERPATESAQQAIAHLDDIAKQQGLSVGPVTLGDRTVYAWTKLSTAFGKRLPLGLQAEVRGVHASIGNYELFTTSIAAMDRALQAVDQSLASQPRFQEATEALQTPNNGYLYLDWTTGQGILEQQFPLLKVIELTAQPLFRHLQSLTVSSYGTESGIQRGGLFLKLS